MLMSKLYEVWIKFTVTDPPDASDENSGGPNESRLLSSLYLRVLRWSTLGPQ